MQKQLELELKVGLFVVIGLVVTMASIFILGNSENLMSRKNHYFVHFNAVDGLIQGSKVVVGGVQVGIVESIGFDKEKRDIRVQLGIVRDLADFIRQGSFAELVTQGVLGDKYISVDSGDQTLAVLPPNSEIPVRTNGGLNQFISKGDQLMGSLNAIAASLDRILKTFESGSRSETFFSGLSATARQLSLVTEKLNRSLDDRNPQSALANLNSILAKINNGTGTLGALVNDPGLYDDAKALMGGANRNRVIRNLVRQTIKNAPNKSKTETGAGTGADETPAEASPPISPQR